MPISSDSYNGIVQFQQNILFLLNTCSRMEGELIDEVNSAMREVIPELFGHSKYCSIRNPKDNNLARE